MVELRIVFASECADLDGPIKPTIDALQLTNARAKRVGAGIISDDRQVRVLHVHRHVDKRFPRIQILVAALPTETAWEDAWEGTIQPFSSRVRE